MTATLDEAFEALRKLMLESAAGMNGADEGEGSLVVRTLWLDPKTRQPAWFGAVQRKKNYVSFHLMPLYASPELRAAVPPALAKRMQGKSCFNFDKPDPALFDDLARLTSACADAWREPAELRPHG